MCTVGDGCALDGVAWTSPRDVFGVVWKELVLTTFCVSHPFKEMGTKCHVSGEIRIIRKTHNLRNLLYILLLVPILTCCLVTRSCPLTPWTVARQAPLSVGFPSQEYWSGLPFLSPGDLPNPGLEPESPALAGGFFTTEPPGKPILSRNFHYSSTITSLIWSL